MTCSTHVVEPEISERDERKVQELRCGNKIDEPLEDDGRVV